MDLVALESSASKLTSASKIRKSKIYKGKFCVQLLPRAAKIDQRQLERFSFFLKDRDGHTLKVSHHLKGLMKQNKALFKKNVFGGVDRVKLTLLNSPMAYNDGERSVQVKYDYCSFNSG